MWLGVWRPVPHGHSSEWEIFSLWRWERSWNCPVLSRKIVTCAALSSWWMLSSSVPISSRCRHSYLGSIFAEDGRLNREIETRVQRANSVSYQLAPLLRYPNIPKQGVYVSSVVCWLLPCGHRLLDGSAIRDLDENSTPPFSLPLLLNHLCKLLPRW